jgi:hypothetical protein
MKKLNNLLLVVFMLQASFYCYGQLPITQNGLTLDWNLKGKVGSRYDEYCKTYFDIYKVEGTVINNNKDKAALITAILHFDGQSCNKIYNNDGPSGGEIIKKIFSLDIALKTKHQSQYWVNRIVHLLPNDSMKAYINVEVEHDTSAPGEPNFHFTSDLFDSQNTVSDNQSEEITTENIPDKKVIPDTNPRNYTSLIVGNWQEIHRLSYTNGKTQEEDVTESSKCGASVLQFNYNGEATEWSNCYDSGSITYDSWSISGKQLIYNIGSTQLRTNIYQLDSTILILKTVIDNDNYDINTYQKFK